MKEPRPFLAFLGTIIGLATGAGSLCLLAAWDFRSSVRQYWRSGDIEHLLARAMQYGIAFSGFMTIPYLVCSLLFFSRLRTSRTRWWITIFLGIAPTVLVLSPKLISAWYFITWHIAAACLLGGIAQVAALHMLLSWHGSRTSPSPLLHPNSTHRE
ncbi:hypothetical protein [Luteolibacter sp. LG18]|uniref:hypothetical protein n=1 Tax=Luteolibacter sp. LG18 TaxID=2819286 RepID=UPI002B2BED3C|nr:hypothetical protein llg_07610 [Luteolibacter sp. LG18]